jgi:CHASE3 domain sensor protein
LFALLYQNLQSEAKAKEVTAQTTILSKYFYDAGLAVGAYSLTRNQMFAERYNKLVAQIPVALENLHQLVDEQPKTASRFDAIKQLTQKGLAELAEDKQIVDKGQLNALTDDQGQARKAYKQIKLIADALQQELDQLSADEEQMAVQASRLRFVFVTLSAVVLFAYAAYNCIVQIKANRAR